MGKKRKFNRFIRWIRSDLPEDNKSVLLLGVTKIPSPTLAPRARPHTLHLDHHLATKSQTLDSLPYPRSKPRFLCKTRSNDSLLKLNDFRTEITFTNPNFLDEDADGKLNDCTPIRANQKADDSSSIENSVVVQKSTIINLKSNDTNRFSKRVSFESDKAVESKSSLGFCTELPFEYYHPAARVPKIPESNVIVTAPGIMDKSVDSIGSCSLDVDASSTDFSDSSLESSNCTLRSVGIPTPIKDTSLPTFHIPSNATIETETKKPSYLNLACTVNGYSNITNYDSKHRENFRIPRSREVSPIRPQDYHVTESIQSKESSRFLTPNYPTTMLTSPSKMSENKSQTVIQSGYSYSSSTSRTMTYMSKETRNFAKSMLYNSSNDTVDACMDMSHRTNGIQSKIVSYETSKMSRSSTTNVNGQNKSYSETTVQEKYCNEDNNKEKSFVQQRIERLYGPGALAQGFFISKRKSRLSDSENGDIYMENDISKPNNQETESKESDQFMKQSCSSPSLPVLRHLRPEFRAQLPILSPKKNVGENSMQKSTTVPLSLTSVTNGVENKMPIINGSKSVDQIENKENIKERIIDDIIKPATDVKIETLPSKIITEEIPAAPQVILPISKSEVVNGNDVNGNKHEVIRNGVDNAHTKSEVRDGHYFLNILKNETDRLIVLAEKVEVEMEEKKSVLPDEVLGYLRSASGKARLLVTQKMQQFEGLCHKNINQIPGEPFPTTRQDLQGFWDMVMLQVTQVDQLFKEIDALRANNWVIVEKSPSDNVDSTNKVKKLVIVKKPMSANAEAQRKQREAARKKMLEDRRKAMRDKQKEEQGIEIFVPETS